MARITRRSFLTIIATAVPTATFVRRAHAAVVEHLEADPATLDALAEAVLPAKALGRSGVAKAAKAFRDWGAGYHEGAEVVHGYGTSRLRTLGPTPMTRWSSQLDELDAKAQAAHQKAFKALTVEQRAEIVRAALAGQRVDRMPGVADASHVALAMLAHFYDSSAAADLCYDAQIGKSTCRPLAASARKPLPLIKVSER